jgi:hypothetical protein
LGVLFHSDAEVFIDGLALAIFGETRESVLLLLGAADSGDVGGLVSFKDSDDVGEIKLCFVLLLSFHLKLLL